MVFEIIENVVPILNYNLLSWFSINVDFSEYGKFPLEPLTNVLGEDVAIIQSADHGVVVFANATTVVICCSEKEWKSNLEDVVIFIKSFYTDEEAIEYFRSFA